MKRILPLIIALLISFAANAQMSSQDTSFIADRSVVFAQYDTTILAMDLYLPADISKLHDCIIFSYGGGFVHNNQRNSEYAAFCRRLADEGGFVVAAIDYRLGMKGVVIKGTLSAVKPTENAIRMATEDLFKALGCILDNSAEFGVDPSKIILCGSSAGAIMSLQADFELCNATPMTRLIPSDFRFAGVISFAGAVFSREGKCKYTRHAPAPTFFLHGTKDILVKYDKIAFFKLRFSGSNDLVKQFKKNHWPYKIMRFEGEGHGVAKRINDNYDDVVWFIDNMVDKGIHFEIDETVFDQNRKKEAWEMMKTNDLYK